VNTCAEPVGVFIVLISQIASLLEGLGMPVREGAVGEAALDAVLVNLPLVAGGGIVHPAITEAAVEVVGVQDEDLV